MNNAEHLLPGSATLINIELVGTGNEVCDVVAQFAKIPNPYLEHFNKYELASQRIRMFRDTTFIATVSGEKP
jgi:hypothetical protein